jgi:hypothetical protein
MLSGSAIAVPPKSLVEGSIVTFGSDTAISSNVTSLVPVLVIVVDIVVKPPIPEAKQLPGEVSFEVTEEIRMLLVVADIGVREPNPEVSVCFTGFPLFM